MKHIPVYIGVYCLLAGCASQSLTAPVTNPLAPLTPIQVGIAVGVVLEDLAETPEADAADATALEMASDLLNLPWRLAIAMTAIAGGFVWTAADLPIHGYEKGAYNKRVDAILAWLPHQSAMPEQGR